MDEISLNIKAPNQKYDDLKLKCQLSWTILDLKSCLSKEYPSKPEISDQRLIYSGQLLKDQEYLKDIIKSPSEDSTYTFHLVCPQKQASTSSEQSNKASAESSSASQSTTASTSSGEGMYAAFRAQNGAFLNQLGPYNNSAVHESYHAMMSQYYQYMSTLYLSSPPPVTDMASYYAFTNAYMTQMNPNVSAFPNLNPTENVNNNANVANENQGNAPVINNNNNINNRNNNQADNAEINRDWMEMLYSFSKAMVVVSIMYFYSSFGRLLLLVIIGFALYMYKNARLNGLQNVLNNNNNNNNVEQENGREQPNEPEPENNNEENGDNQEAASDAINGDNNASNPAPPNEMPPYSGLRLVWVFVSSLFTSLIPEPAPIG